MDNNILICNFGGLEIKIQDNRAGFLPKLSTNVDSVTPPAPEDIKPEIQWTLSNFRNYVKDYDIYETTITCNWRKFKELICFESFYLRVAQCFTKSINLYAIKEIPYPGSRAIHLHGIIIDKRKTIGTDAYKKAHTSFRESQRHYDEMKRISKKIKRTVGMHTICSIRDKYQDYKLYENHYFSMIPGERRKIGNMEKYWDYVHKTILTPSKTKSIYKGTFNSTSERTKFKYQTK